MSGGKKVIQKNNGMSRGKDQGRERETDRESEREIKIIFRGNER